MPLMMVWPDSWSTETRNEGSSWARRCSATPSFSWSPLVLGSTATSMTGSGNSMRSRITGLVGIAQRIAGGDVLEAGQRHDVAGIGFLDVLAVIGVHQQHAADALLLVFHRIDQRGAGFHLAGIDAGEGERAHERVVHDLEGQHGQRRGVVWRPRRFLAGLDVDALDRRHVERRRQIIDHRVEHRLHALVLEGGAAQDRHEHVVHGALADHRLDRVLAGLGALEIFLHHALVELDRLLDQLLAIFLGLSQQIARNVLVMEGGAERLVVPHHRLHAHQVDDAPEARTRRRAAAGSRSDWRRGDP